MGNALFASVCEDIWMATGKSKIIFLSYHKKGSSFYN